MAVVLPNAAVADEQLVPRPLPVNHHQVLDTNQFAWHIKRFRAKPLHV